VSEKREWAKKVVGAHEKANVSGNASASVDDQILDVASIRMAQNTREHVQSGDPPGERRNMGARRWA